MAIAIQPSINLHNVAHHPPQETFASQPINSQQSVYKGVVILRHFTN